MEVVNVGLLPVEPRGEMMKEGENLWDVGELEIKQLFLTLDRIDKYINVANLKASLIIPAAGILLAFLSEKRAEYLNLLAIDGLSWVAPFSYVLTLVALTLSIFFALRVLLPFLESGTKSPGYRSLLYFGSIAELSFDDYFAGLKSMTRTSLATDVAQQAHLLSGALTKKFKASDRGFKLLFLGFFIPGSVLALDSLAYLFGFFV